MVETNNFPFEVKVILGLETTFLVCRVGGWVVGWLDYLEIYNQLSPQLGWVGAWTELGKK